MVNEKNVETGRFRVKRFQGVYSRPSAKRIFQGKPDRCLTSVTRISAGGFFGRKLGGYLKGTRPQWRPRFGANA